MMAYSLGHMFQPRIPSKPESPSDSFGIVVREEDILSKVRPDIFTTVLTVVGFESVSMGNLIVVLESPSVLFWPCPSDLTHSSNIPVDERLIGSTSSDSG